MTFLAPFKYDFVPKSSYANIVARSAVLYPILKMWPKGEIGGYRTTGEHDRTITKATFRLIKMWRARVLALSNNGWKRAGVVTEGNLFTEPVVFMMNCCPCFTSMKPEKLRCCRRRQVCPFCYARRVVDIWKVIDHAFPNVLGEVDPEVVGQEPEIDDYASFATDTPSRGRAMVFDAEGTSTRSRKRRVFPNHLVDVVFTVKILAKDNRHVGDIIKAAASQRSSGVTNLDIDGAFIHTTIEPWRTRGAKTGWIVKHKYLLMVPAKLELPTYLTSEKSYKRIKNPTRRRINNAVIRICSYPRQMMVGDEYHVAHLLNEMGGRRLSAFYGEFRNVSRRKREEKRRAE